MKPETGPKEGDESSFTWWTFLLRVPFRTQPPVISVGCCLRCKHLITEQRVIGFESKFSFLDECPYHLLHCLYMDNVAMIYFGTPQSNAHLPLVFTGQLLLSLSWGHLTSSYFVGIGQPLSKVVQCNGEYSTISTALHCHDASTIKHIYLIWESLKALWSDYCVSDTVRQSSEKTDSAP